MRTQQNNMQQGLIISEDDDGITAITPSACLSIMRDAATEYPASSILLSIAGSAALVWFAQDVFFPYRVVGTFGDGALSTYDEGRQAALVAFNHSTAENYSIYQMSNTDYANPYQLDANRALFLILWRIALTATSFGIVGLRLLDYFSKKDNSVKAHPFIFMLPWLAMCVVIPLVDAFALVPGAQDGFYTEGQELGSSTYGCADGQNYYCNSLIYNGTCPDPSMYYTLLQTDANAQRITPTVEVIFLFAQALATMMIAPIVSTVLSCGKGVYGYCRRSSMFGASENNDSDSYQYENEPADQKVSSMDVESKSGNTRSTFQ